MEGRFSDRKTKKLSLVEKQNRTALISVTGLGRKFFRNVLKTRKKLGMNWVDFWVGKGKIWEKSGLNKKTCESILKFKKEYKICAYWEYLKKKNISVVDELDKNYPQLLFEAEDRPPILFVKGEIGEISIWDKTPVAIVGTRKITSYGKMVTKKISRELVLENATIISGFMYGVDVCAQLSALEAGGRTVGVLGYGFDHVSPWDHVKIMESMLQDGAVFVTEYPPWISASPGTYPTRNRIVAGMSLGVVVTEAAKKSGSHITANLALDYGREVFAVPGSITSPYSVGTKDLIKQGAIMVGSGGEVMRELGGEKENNNERDNEGIGQKLNQSGKELSLEEKILKMLKIESMSSDELVRELGLEITKVVSILSLLEVRGVISKDGGRYYFEHLGLKNVVK